MRFYQIALPVFTVVYLLQVFVIQSWIQWKKTGVKPYVFGNTDSPHDYCGKVYKLMIVATWVSISFFSFFQDQYKFLLPFWYLEFDWLKHVGFGMGLTSFVWIIVAPEIAEKRLHGLLDGAKKKLVVVIPVLLRIWIITITSLVEVLNTQTSETGGEHMLGNGEPGVPMSTAI
jgi:hypothetical protein